MLPVTACKWRDDMGLNQLSMNLIACSPAVTCRSPAFVSNLVSPSHLRVRPRLQPPAVFSPSAASASAASLTVGCLPGAISRRASILALLPFLIFPSPAVASPSDGGDDLQRYTDQTEGFTLLISPSWVKVFSSFFLASLAKAG